MRDNVDRHWDDIESAFSCEHLDEKLVGGVEGWVRRRRGERAFICQDCGTTRIVRMHRIQ